MKVRILTALLAVLLLAALTGCSLERTVDKAEDALENVIQTAAVPAPTTGSPSPTAITREEAQAIALEHAGFTADQVTYLRTDYEIDDGVPQYEVRFHQGRWEYDYEINAQTGAILSYDRDD